MTSAVVPRGLLALGVTCLLRHLLKPQPRAFHQAGFVSGGLRGGSRLAAAASRRGGVSARPARRLVACRSAGRLGRRAELFLRLDADGDGQLSSPEMLSFAELTGFDGDEQDWALEFEDLCGLGGCDFDAFCALVDDDSDEGCFLSVEEMDEMLAALPERIGKTIPPAPAYVREVDRDHWIAEREAGLYEGIGSEWKPEEGLSARSPRIGRVQSMAGCPRTASPQEAIAYVSEQVRNGLYGGASDVVDTRLSELMAKAASAAGDAGWFEFRLDETLLGSRELADVVLAPDGWDVIRPSIPPGYMMHIMTNGQGVRATLTGRESQSIVNALHRDVSGSDKVFCDTCLCGVLGRKRVLVFSPDAFPGDDSFPRSPDMRDPRLKPLEELPPEKQEEAWQGLEKLALQDGMLGGAYNLGPGRCIFVPHGWWHAVRPIDDFTFITGPSHLSGVSMGTASR